MTKSEIMSMLKERATRCETDYFTYEEYLSNPTIAARESIENSTKLAIKKVIQPLDRKRKSWFTKRKRNQNQIKNEVTFFDRY